MPGRVSDFPSSEFFRKTIVRQSLSCLLLSASGVMAEQATAQHKAEQEIERIQVFGRGEQLTGQANTASEGVVAGSDLLVRPMLRTAELLQAVPGLTAAQHSGSGKANQYFLRGFQLDHGTDFTAYVDGMPWNLRTHGHGQGYLDVNGLIPETVERIEYRKGPYHADTGDFSLAGAAYMSSIDRLDSQFVALESGSYGARRLAGGATTELAKGELTTIAEYKVYDGPWQLEENLQHKSLWSKYLQQTEYGSWQLTLSGYLANWQPTEQTPESAIGTELCADAYCSLDPSAKGETSRWILTSNWQGADWQATLYAQHYDWFMLSNATYLSDGQINQFDRRQTAGGQYNKLWDLNHWLQLKSGTEFRHDHIAAVGLDSTAEGNFVSNISNHKVQQSSAAVYIALQAQATEQLRFNLAGRSDLYHAKVSANTGSGDLNNNGTATDSIHSPKLGVAYLIQPQVELYANYGKGFHSNDARGVVKTEQPVASLMPGTGYESGLRWALADAKFSATYWWLELSSELIFVGDSNTVEPKGGAKRQGYEVTGFWQPLSWLGLDAVYTHNNAKNSDPEQAGGTFVEGAMKSSAEIGVSARYQNWEFSSRYRYLGAYPLLPDNSESAGSEQQLNLRLAKSFQHFTLYSEVLNALDHQGKDIVYFYENLFDPAGGRVSRAEEPRTFRIGLKYNF